MKRILRVLTCSGGFSKKDKADEPEQAKNASAPATDAASEVSAEKATAEQKSLNSSFEIIETNDPALAQCEPDSENKQEESKEDEKVLETKEIPAESQPEESSPTENPAAQKEEEKESQTVDEEKELRRKQSEAEIQAFEQELAEEAKTLKNLSDAEEKVSVANESKPEQKPVEQEEPEPAKSQNEAPISEPENEPEPAQESEPIVEEAEKTEQPKLDDLENEDEKDSGNVSEEKSTEESIEKVKAISDDCEKAVKRTASEIEELVEMALRAEILRNILIAKELESEKQNSAENKDDSKEILQAGRRTKRESTSFRSQSTRNGDFFKTKFRRKMEPDQENKVLNSVHQLL
ncbi:Oidioi.mRNA.OKI2018_I69.chr1.g423.t1.cds [Oikopleura dioica]|uniref:Oidioi.mRNA.OKI2018_I69.chr1.g423.t1.cds n=1 Tax=Oikopleura dioica TaxID=34765 RepID=A0ABN7SJS9_OIKDI|nr:Oidioi.mRNA.OKI2018_I69.chr1.g423.t1.cds [Oikopleura dioica]